MGLEEHLTREDLVRLVTADLDREERRVLFHALAACAGCRPVVGPFVELLESGTLPLEFGVIDLSLAESRLEADELLSELLASRDRHRVLRKARFRSWGLCELLIQVSREQSREPGESFELAQLAVQVADRLVEDEPCERAWLLQLRGVAKACVADAENRQGKREGARRTFEKAQKLWEEGAGESGDVLGLEAVMSAIKSKMEA